MYQAPYPMYQVTESVVDRTRVNLTTRLKRIEVFDSAQKEEVIPLLRGAFQSVLMRGLDFDDQEEELVRLLALVAQAGYKADITAGLDKACEYWTGKLIGEPALAGTFLMNGHTAYRHMVDHDTGSIVVNLTFYVYSLLLLAEVSEDKHYSTLPFLTL